MEDQTFDAERATASLEKFLSGLIAAGRLQLTFEIQRTSGQFQREFETPDLVVSFSGRDADLLLENKGEVLKALEQVALEALRLDHHAHERIFFDCQEYRLMRIEELALAAQAAAEKVKRTGIPYKFGPMSSRERRVIHMALRGEADVRTESEGVGLHRQVVVHPKQAPAPPSRPLGRRR